MKRILTSLMLVASVYSFAQVSISGEADDTPQATLDVKAIGGKTNGILVPRVTKEEADDMPSPQAGDIEESTLIYITGDVSKAGTKYATEVKTNGFYYFKGGKWVKLGGGSASTESVSLNKVTGKVQTLPTPVTADQIEEDTFALIVTGASTTNVTLPDASLFPSRVLSVNNQGGSVLSFLTGTSPLNANTVDPGAGFLMISNGTRWVVIGGVGN